MTMEIAVLHRAACATVVDYRCRARPGDPAVEERHRDLSLSYVRRGTFGYRSRGAAHELVAGATLVGHAGEAYRCTHDHHGGGDECLSFQFSADALEALGAAPRPWPA
ncbi:hypothetical protein ACOQFB_20850 [Anaeromyxobacter sp. Red801]|uniref:hypothetical protein n=1 Tax=Anaeromyxobacter sp. Red801 TaxID=3411632 RepID=UPI003B9E6B8E